jgi:D-alanyl-D-alanine carboxypeptidase
MRSGRATSRNIGVLLILGAFLPSCSQAGASGGDQARVRAALAAMAVGPAARATIQGRIDRAPKPFKLFLAQALADRAADPMLLYRVDKSRALPEGYAPGDLQALDGTGLSVSRAGHRLRKPAVAALKAMNAAALKDGLSLLVSSGYRSYGYQVGLFAGIVKELGLAKAEMESAAPGHSQHQLGTAIDFGSITDAFADTKAARWLSANARRFGFTLSYPKGLTDVTGYKWESWHYRYIGKAAAAMEAEYFGGIQEYLLLFLESYE